MLYYEVLSLVSFWSLLASTTSGAILPSPTTTPPPDLLRARDSDARVCGTNSRHGPVWCSSSSEVCRATILAPGTAWAYCSKPGKIDQVVLTEAVGNWPASKPCPTSSYCWYDSAITHISISDRNLKANLLLYTAVADIRKFKLSTSSPRVTQSPASSAAKTS